MVQSKTPSSGPALVIVESPAKAKTIGKYLGPGYIVEASVGHVRDLAKGASKLPPEFRKKPWARLAVNVDSNFEPFYEIPSDKLKQVAKLKAQLKSASSLYLATDEDREGEAISWHLLEILKPKVPVRRLVFHEITKNAILNALNHTRDLNMDLVKAQETRRILDRLYGYESSPLLWHKISRPGTSTGNNLSAGRVQSVAVRLIVDRERERMAFHSADFWDVLGEFVTSGANSFQATLTSVADKAIPSGKDFDPSNGLLKTPSKFTLLDEKATQELVDRLSKSQAIVESVDEKPYTTRPYAPFTTSALQQEANRKLNFTARKTMSVAQSLYENGRITYMRTDSTNLSWEAINAARELVKVHYGEEFLPEKPRVYQTKVKNAQEAHEAIRPAGNSFPLPDELRSQLSYDEYLLYDLIWKRTVASQMTDSRGMRKTIVVAIDDARFQVGGKTIVFPGYLRAYVEGKDDPNAELADQETLLPDVKQGDALETRELKPQKHTTSPPQRYSEASLTKTLEDKGIGRPSTYASTIDVILKRNYVFKKGGALVPTWTGIAVCQLMEKHFPELVDYGFTADMENALDEISNGNRDETSYLRAFYFGDVDNHPSDGAQSEFPFPPTFAAGLKRQIENKMAEIDPRDASQFLIGTPINEDGSKGVPVFVRVGHYSLYLEQGDVHARFPDDMPPDELTLEKALELINASKAADEPIGKHPETGKPIYLKNGPYGRYVQCGDLKDDEEPQKASLLKGMTESDVTLDVALQLLSLPKSLGVDPSINEPVLVCNGRFGPFVKRGSETRSLPAGVSPFTITLDEALALLAQEKYRARKKATKSEPLKTFGNSPVTGEEVKLLKGPYGPFVTDGKVNASIPKDLSLEDLTSERALELLAARAARGATTRKRAAKKASTKKTTTKKTTAKKTAAKKTTVKKKATKKAAKKTTAKKTTRITNKQASPDGTSEPPF